MDTSNITPIMGRGLRSLDFTRRWGRLTREDRVIMELRPLVGLVRDLLSDGGDYHHMLIRTRLALAKVQS